MARADRLGFFLLAVAVASATAVSAAGAQQTQFPKPTELPNPYRLVEGWPTLPQSMNGGQWGEVIRVSVARDGNIWIFHRCFNIVPPGHATCLGRGDSDPPILEFDPSGTLLKSFGVGLFAYPHAFTIDGDGNLWTSDVNDEPAVLGMSAKNADGVIRGQEVLKLNQNGKVLMMLCKEGVAGDGPDTFDRPTGVAVAPNGDIFVSDGHYPNAHNSARVVKFTRTANSSRLGDEKDRRLVSSTSLMTSSSAVHRTACMSPIAATAESRFLIKKATSSRHGHSLVSQVPSLSERMIRSMWARPSQIRRPRKVRCEAS